MKRATIIVLDNVGCGSSPDAHLYGDEGSNTLAHVAAVVPGMKLPNLAGVGNWPDPGCDRHRTGLTTRANMCPSSLTGRNRRLGLIWVNVPALATWLRHCRTI